VRDTGLVTRDSTASLLNGGLYWLMDMCYSKANYEYCVSCLT
jgi:hypothetical protein